MGGRNTGPHAGDRGPTLADRWVIACAAVLVPVIVASWVILPGRAPYWLVAGVEATALVVMFAVPLTSRPLSITVDRAAYAPGDRILVFVTARRGALAGPVAITLVCERMWGPSPVSDGPPLHRERVVVDARAGRATAALTVPDLDAPGPPGGDVASGRCAPAGRVASVS
jgi:hypothetical protein